MEVISWLIVLIPFIYTTVITSLLLYIFGLNKVNGKNTTINLQNVSRDVNGNIIVYDPTYNPTVNPVYYKSPNIIIPQPNYNKIITI
jgi:hypothetical protein